MRWKVVAVVSAASSLELYASSRSADNYRYIDLYFEQLKDVKIGTFAIVNYGLFNLI